MFPAAGAAKSGYKDTTAAKSGYREATAAKSGKRGAGAAESGYREATAAKSGFTDAGGFRVGRVCLGISRRWMDGNAESCDCGYAGNRGKDIFQKDND